MRIIIILLIFMSGLATAEMGANFKEGLWELHQDMTTAQGKPMSITLQQCLTKHFVTEPKPFVQSPAISEKKCSVNKTQKDATNWVVKVVCKEGGGMDMQFHLDPNGEKFEVKNTMQSKQGSMTSKISGRYMSAICPVSKTQVQGK